MRAILTYSPSEPENEEPGDRGRNGTAPVASGGVGGSGSTGVGRLRAAGREHESEPSQCLSGRFTAADEQHLFIRDENVQRILR
jgi:hypothetical protein